MKSKKIIFFIFAFLIIKISNSQHLNYPLGFDLNMVLNCEISKSDSIIHTGFRPLRQSYINSFTDTDSIVYQKNYNSDFISKMPVKWFWRKLFDEDFVKLETENLDLYFNPLINYFHGNLRNDTTTYMQNTRGIQIKGNLGNKISFYSDFYENQAFFIPFVNEKVSKRLVVPGQGAWKTFRTTGYDFAMASGYVSFVPAKFFSLQFGHGKHFIGEGYRSLLLSDNSFNYPYLKFEFTFGKVQYTSMFTEFNDFYGIFYYYHFKKHGTFNYLSYSPHHRIQIGLFEGIIWRTTDDSTYVKKFPVSYFNPIILTRVAQYKLNNENNIILGLNLKIKPSKYTQIYAQGVLDNIDFSELKAGSRYFENKFGYQIGAKVFDAFHGYLKKQSLYLQYEYNSVNPYTYSHDIVRQSYTHYNQELAHPLGAGFKESILIANYSFYNFYLRFKLNKVVTSTDTSGTNFGSNIFISNSDENYDLNIYQNYIGQGNITNIISKNLTIGYIFNHKTYLQIFSDLLIRDFNNNIENYQTFYVTFGFRTSLNNYYYDY